MSRRPPPEARLSSLSDQFEALATSLSDLTLQLHAIPYMSDPSILETRDDAGRPAIGYRRQAVEQGPAHSYAGFEDVFRGSENFIRERQRVYLPYLVDHDPVVDVGCGRGEMLGSSRRSWASSPSVSIATSRWSSVEEKKACRLSWAMGFRTFTNSRKDQ